jgi:hypothetical protein
MCGVGQHPTFVARLSSQGGTIVNTSISTNTYVAAKTEQYLSERLDGARDLYLLALALGKRDGSSAVFGSLIREARIHFAAVLEEARIAGLDTTAIATMLGKQSEELGNNIRPEIWSRVEQLAQSRHQKQPA